MTIHQGEAATAAAVLEEAAESDCRGALAAGVVVSEVLSRAAAIPEAEDIRAAAIPGAEEIRAAVEDTRETAEDIQGAGSPEIQETGIEI
jgi:hypothetical protein